MMPDPNFEARLADAFRRYAGRVPADVDAAALAREIATASTREAGRRRGWWPFGKTSTITGRTRTMLSPAKAITAAALVFAIGGALLVAQPLGQRANVPGVATDEHIPPVEVTGTSLSPMGCIEMNYEGPFEDVGVDAYRFACSTETGMPWSMSDPRLEGTVQRVNEESRIRLEDGTWLYIAQSAFSIENEGGTWRERPRFWLLPDGYGPTSDWLPEEVIVLDGAGGYEGLVAVVRVEGLSEFHGFILDERLFPPAPENASAR